MPLAAFCWSSKLILTETAGSRFRLATLKYAPQDGGGAAGPDGNASMPPHSDLRGAFDQVRSHRELLEAL